MVFGFNLQQSYVWQGRDAFKLDKTFDLEVKFGNDIIVPVKDKGKIFIQLNNGS